MDTDNRSIMEIMIDMKNLVEQIEKESEYFINYYNKEKDDE